MEVEIWSDIACPWCYVGKRRFEAALAAFEERDAVNVTWRSFELDPSSATERDVDSTTHLATKYGRTLDEARAMQRQMDDVAAGDGLAMHSSAMPARRQHLRRRTVCCTWRTIAASRMRSRKRLPARVPQRRARRSGVPRRSRGSRSRSGSTATRCAAVLAGDRYAAEVRDDERTATALGIHAVPFFVVDRAVGASGAQSPEILGQLLRHCVRNGDRADRVLRARHGGRGAASLRRVPRT